MSIPPDQLVPLIDRYWSVLINWVGGRDAEAEDIVQLAFVKLAAQEPQPDDSVAWLFAVSRRLAINARLAASRRKKHEQLARKTASDQLHPGLGVEASELREQLSKLDSVEREIVVAHVWGQLTFDQIAQATGSSKAKVWRTYQTAIKKLQTYYGAL